LTKLLKYVFGTRAIDCGIAKTEIGLHIFSEWGNILAAGKSDFKINK
jgi:hypothetical protein